MATTTARRHSAHPMSYYWGMVKDMDDSMKLELITLLAESVKPAIMVQPQMKRYTMDDIHAMIDEAEAEIAAGGGIDDDVLWKEDEEEFKRELAEEQRLQLEAV